MVIYVIVLVKNGAIFASVISIFPGSVKNCISLLYHLFATTDRDGRVSAHSATGRRIDPSLWTH